jgi:N-carbamoyl-L-amino-acid hydrolase
MDIRIDMDRLKKDILDLSQIGRDPTGAISRPSFSRTDLEAREWLKNRIKDAGLIVREDGAGNIFGRIEGQGGTVMSGSHLDTVIHGGMYDGSVGVLSALECARLIKENSLPITKPLEVASFTDEEGNLVGDFLGSRAFLGLLNREKLEKGRTQFGTPLAQILEGTGFSIDSIMEAHKQKPEIDTFLELHIEQGIQLETEGCSIGIVDSIAGKNVWLCSFSGIASHAGTTPLELRHDALLGLADFALKGTQHVATHHYGSMVTVGKLQVFPGAFSTVPGRADFTLDFRSASQETLKELESFFTSLARDIASTRGLHFASETFDSTEPVALPPKLLITMKEECKSLGYPFMMLSSGAGHDAQVIAGAADSGMIFIPCMDGISHSPEEKIAWEDLEKGANLLLRTLLRQAQ